MELPLTIAFSTIASLAAAYLVLKCRCALAPDVHKLNRPMIPKIGGLIVISYIAVFTAFTRPWDNWTNLLYYTAPIVMGIIGIVDDFTHVHEYIRVSASVLYPLLILVFSDASEYIYFPLIGHFSNPLVISVLTIVAYAIFSNAINMMDVVNGIVPLSTMMASIIPLAYSLIRGNVELLQMTLALLIPSAILYYLNRYPAKVFNGNGGTYALGALVAGLVLYSRLGSLIMLILSPYIVNGLLIIVSSRGIKSREKLKPSTYMDSSLVIKPNLESGSTLTLMKLIVLDKPGDERSVIRGFVYIFASTTLLTLVLFVVMVMLRWL